MIRKNKNKIKKLYLQGSLLFLKIKLPSGFTIILKIREKIG
jgi:hypothetical protein